MKKTIFKLSAFTPLIVLTLAGCSQTTETNVNIAPTNTASTVNTVSSNINSNSLNTNLNTNSVNVNQSSNSVNVSTGQKPKQPPTKMPTPNIGSGGNDLSIMMSARNAIISDKELVNSVIIEVKDGNVLLNGKVLNEQQKQRAEELVRNVSGVRSIKNNIRIGS